MRNIAGIIMLLLVLSAGAETIIEESFDEISLPAGWTQENESGNVSWMTYSGGHNSNPSGPHSGDRNAYIFAETCITRLVTPMLNIGGSNSATLTFYHAHVAWLGQQDILRIYYKSEPDNEWGLLQTYDYSQATWEYETINLPDESSSYYIAFEAECDWGHGVVLDDVEVEGEPSPVGVVEGHVYNASGIPLTDAEVVIEDISMSTLTEPGGFYQILGVPEGYHSFFASKDGYGFDQTEATVAAGETLVLDFNLQEYQEVIISGSVISSDGGTPVQGALITLEGFEDYEAQSAANGDFIIPGVWSNNTYEMTVSKPSYNPYNENINVGEENYNVGDVTLIAPIQINGWVNTTAHPDSGLASAQVVLSGYETHEVETAANGQFIIPEVYANENYTIEVSYDNHNPWQTFLDIEEEDIDLETITLISPVSLTGRVVSTNDPDTGLIEADVSLSGYAYHSVETDSLGYFEITEIYANEDYDLEIEYPDHNPYSDNVDIEAVDLELGTITLIGPVLVSGYIYGSDDLENGLAGAEITVTGYEYHSTETDSTGYYMIEEVYANEDYTISVEADNYEDFEDDFAVESIDFVMPDIILNEITIPAGNVQAEVVGETSAQVHWNPPGSGSYEFRYDDGNPYAEIGLNGPRAVIGAVHPYNAVVNQVQWYLTNSHSHPYVKVYIFGLNGSGQPNSNDLLYQSNNISNYSNQWRTYTLPTPISAPNGFMVGICTPNYWTDLAMDNGAGEPWVFESDTQYSTPDYQTGEWNDIENHPSAGNLLLRAYGINLGPALDRDFEGYQVFRLPPEEMQDPEAWELIASGIQDTSYTDETWWYLDEGEWTYAVRCEHTNQVYSMAAFSNILEKDAPPEYLVEIYVNNQDGQPVQFAQCRLTSWWNEYTTLTNSAGLADYDDVQPGIYNLRISHSSYEDFLLEDILIVDDYTQNVTLSNTSGENNELEAISGVAGIYPNPFNPSTEIFFELAAAEQVLISVYNMRGQLVEELCNKTLPSGSHTVTWQAEGLSSGIYYLHFKTDDIRQMKKMVLMK